MKNEELKNSGTSNLITLKTPIPAFPHEGKERILSYFQNALSFPPWGKLERGFKLFSKHQPGFHCVLGSLWQKGLLDTGKFFIIFLIISLYFIVFPGSPIYSQPDSLVEYLEIAAKNNPAVLQKFTEYQASLQKVPQAGSLSDPQLDIGVFLSPMELMNGNQVADIRLMQMFPWFGVLRNAKDEMSQMANAKYEQFRDAKLQVFYEVQRTWYELYKIRKDIKISEKNIEILETIEKLALIRFKTAPTGGSSATPSGSPSGSSRSSSPGAGSSGMKGMSGGTSSAGNAPAGQPPMSSGTMSSSPTGSSLSDIYRIQIEAGNLENSISLLKNQEQTVTAQFNNYLNRNYASTVFTSDTLIADTLDLPLSAVTDSITLNNPMLSMIEFEQKSYQARKRMVKKMGYPMLGLGINYSIINSSEMAASPSMNGKDMIMPMLSVTLPVYRKKYNAMQKEADLLGNAAKFNYESIANELHNEYYQAVQLYQDARRRIKLYENQYLLASKSLDLMLRSFSTSASDMTDVLRVQQQTLDYELNKIEAVADLNTSVAWLRRLMASTDRK